MNTRRQAFLLAGALTATVFTTVAALAGIAHRPASASRPTAAPVIQVAQQQPPHEWADD